jgi:isopentenyl diphosphate isomerase/L-lactate dehydrogenase-like FMN-dependent dehydrogenase
MNASLGPLVSCADYEAAAAKALASSTSAAPGTWTYFSSGAEDEVTLERNRACFNDWALLPRALVDVSSVNTSTTILGHSVSQPFGIAPSAFQRLLHPDGELGMTRAAIACNIPHCLSSSATTSLEDVAAEARGRGLRFMQVRG